MDQDESCTDVVDIMARYTPDAIEDPEEFADIENPYSELPETISRTTIEDSEHTSENLLDAVEKKEQPSKVEVVRLTRLPIGRVKNIMKMDPDVNIINSDAAFLITKATELFLETIAKETYTYTANKKRKTIAKKDLDNVINMVDCLCFLEGAMDF